MPRIQVGIQSIEVSAKVDRLDSAAMELISSLLERSTAPVCVALISCNLNGTLPRLSRWCMPIGGNKDTRGLVENYETFVLFYNPVKSRYKQSLVVVLFINYVSTM